MPGRTWVIAPDADSLTRRWQALIKAKAERKEALFVPHLNNGKLGDRHVKRVVAKGLPGFADNPKPIANERGDCLPPVRYALPLVRPPVDHPGQPRDQSAQPGTVAGTLGDAGLLDGTSSDIAAHRVRP